MIPTYALRAEWMYRNQLKEERVCVLIHWEEVEGSSFRLRFLRWWRWLPFSFFHCFVDTPPWFPLDARLSTNLVNVNGLWDMRDFLHFICVLSDWNLLFLNSLTKLFFFFFFLKYLSSQRTLERPWPGVPRTVVPLSFPQHQPHYLYIPLFPLIFNIHCILFFCL